LKTRMNFFGSEREGGPARGQSLPRAANSAALLTDH
jgi:hypothetical protein